MLQNCYPIFAKNPAMRLLTLIFFLSVLIGCNESSTIKKEITEPEKQEIIRQKVPAVELDNSPITIANIAGKYIGNLPCADCEALKYVLILNADGTYTEQRTYIGKQAETEETVGKFEITTENKIKLTKRTPGMEYLFKTKSGLLLLDIDGNVINGPLANKYELLPYSAETSGITDKNERMWTEGIEFYAQGNEPNWNLTLDYNSAIVFGLQDKPAITFPIVEPEYNEEEKTLTYTILEENYGLKLIINLDGQCTDDMSGQIFDTSVRVEFREGSQAAYKKLKGCGNFTINPELLRYTWQLASLDDYPANPTMYSNGLPELTFRMFDRGFGGTDGCNQLGGGYNMQADKIQFSAFASTAMSCPLMNASRDFNFALQQSMFSYVIYDEMLTLTNLQHTIIFSKKH